MRRFGVFLVVATIVGVGFLMPQPYGIEVSVPGTAVFVVGVTLAFWPKRRIR